MCQEPINKIKEVIESKGFKEIKPTDIQLQNMDTTMNMWNKWVGKKRDPDLYQLPAIADFLKCEVSEIIQLPEKISA